MKLALFLVLCAAIGAGADKAIGHRDKIGAPVTSIHLHGSAPAIRLLP